MEDIKVRKEDQILMNLVHYFVTEENYSPILVQGVKDEIWLENPKGPYRVIRINSNLIRNEEQYKFDQYKVHDILRQIKKKTLSFSINALNINLNEEEGIKNPPVKWVDNLRIKSLKEAKDNKDLNEIFPKLKDSLYKEVGLDLIFNVTKDINQKTEVENKKFEKIFTKKKTVITYILMILCIIMFALTIILGEGNITTYSLLILGANYKDLILSGQVYRLITYAFLHGGFIHLFANLYSMKVICPSLESRIGKLRFILVYLISALTGGMLSCIFNDGLSIGASGALFGVLGAHLYFGYYFRLYLREELTKSLLPVLLINLLLGFTISGIDMACHIGGLIGGILTMMMVGIPLNKNKKDRINGSILLAIFLLFEVYLLFFR